MVKPEGILDFIEGVKKVGEALKKTNTQMSGTNHWYQLLNGGEGPHYITPTLISATI